jgi:type 2 lantibiotic biosynthesis protein LanM
LLEPLVNWNWQQVCGIDGLGPAWCADAQESARQDLRQRLSALCAPAFASDFDDTRPLGTTLLLRLGAYQADRPHTSDVFAAWCRRHLADGLTQLLGRFPVLGRLIATSCAQWRTNFVKLIQRLAHDRPLLSAHFGIPQQALLMNAEWGLSDPHRGGQSVVILDFQCELGPRRLVYKPKNLRMEQGFQQVMGQLGIWLADPAWRSLEVLPCGSAYGYTSHVAYQPCAGTDLAGFYRNAGRLLALLHLLGATDAHFENLIACGCSLHLIDAETLFQGRMLDRAQVDLTEATRENVLESSVLRVGMLPCWSPGADAQRASDITALGVNAVPGAQRVPGWLHINSDDMVLTQVPAAPRQAPSLPVAQGVDNPLELHEDALQTGFAEVYRLAMQPGYQQCLLAAVTGFSGAARRVVLRATRVYVTVQQDALRAPAVAHANRRAFALEKLARQRLLAANQGPAWTVFIAELFDMEQLDVPYFEHHLGSLDVIASTGIIPGLLLSDGLDDALQRIGRLSQTDLAWQQRLIRAAIHARFQHPGHGLEPSAPGADDPPTADTSTTSIAAMADQLCQDLAESAFDDGLGQVSWLTCSHWDDTDQVMLGLIGDGLYDGRAGVAVFQSLMAGYKGSVTLAANAHATLTPVLARINATDDYTRLRYLRDAGLGWRGLGGLLRLFILVIRRPMPGDVMLLQYPTFERLLAQISVELISKDQSRDLMSGVAGLIGPVARLHRQTPSAFLSNILRIAARHLTTAQGAAGGWCLAGQKKPLTGLSHGASGMGLALLEAGAALNDDALIASGARAFCYEQDVFDGAVGNWPDFRTHPPGKSLGPRFMVSWCHGAPGIGLARMRALQLLPTHRDAEVWREDLHRAMTTTMHTTPGVMDHLCCGSLGCAAVLRIVGRWAGEPAWVSSASELTHRVVARAQARGSFMLPSQEAGTGQSSTPGLMTGIAGIGLHLASMVMEDDLADLLV